MELSQRFREALLPGLDFVSLRFVDERTESLSVRRGVPQPVSSSEDRGLMVTVVSHGGAGYAATADDSVDGIRAAIRRAAEWADKTRERVLFDPRVMIAHPRGEYGTRVATPWSSTSTADKLQALRAQAAALKAHDDIVDWEAALHRTCVEGVYLTDQGGEVTQRTEIVSPDLSAVASRGALTQRRSFGGRGASRQGGLEVLAQLRIDATPARLAAEALALLDAPDCPTGELDVVLAPDQMMLQIHESIGHPLELDRILGDERNYAGTSFVKPDMFGVYRYGSELLDVTFDPSVDGELASYGFDDDGTPAQREYLIRKGVLERPLGGRVSQARSGLTGVANARASSWNRPPIDRMANLNVEPGDDTFDALVAKVERGVYMVTNASWSIDDSRNNFQFGCEYGRRITDGRLGEIVRNPNYRGVSGTFWRSLAGVGDRSTFEVWGTPFCGKGEPNQLIRVGHASPACMFRGVSVFGGAS